MSNKTEATFHGPPSDPWPAESLPQRDPMMNLADWDGQWLARAQAFRQQAEAPPWVQARRRSEYRDPRWDQALIGIAGVGIVPPRVPPVCPVSQPSRKESWLTAIIASLAACLFVTGVMLGLLLIGS